MSTTLKTLEEKLRDHVSLHKQLLEAADNKRQAIVTGDLEAMEKSLSLEQELIRQVEAIESMRTCLVIQASNELGIQETPVKMRMIIEQAPQEWSEKLATVQQELRELLDKLRYRTRQNAELLQASMEHVRSFLQLVQEATRRNPTYSNAGQRAGNSRSLFDRTA